MTWDRAVTPFILPTVGALFNCRAASHLRNNVRSFTIHRSRDLPRPWPTIDRPALQGGLGGPRPAYVALGGDRVGTD